MSDEKSHQFRPPLYNEDSSPRRPARSGTSSEMGNDQQGWDAYRKWLSSVSGKARNERTPVDHSIYSWKGYHNWADRVRQSWKSDKN